MHVSHSQSPSIRYAAQDNLESFVASAPMAIHCADAHGRILWANAAELSLLGYAQKDYVGRLEREHFVEPELAAQLRDRLARGEVVRDFEARLRTKTGATRHVLISASAELEDGRLKQSHCFTRDVTERKNAELEQQRLVAELERTVRLNEMLASILIHDLRNPLGAIMAGAQLIQRYSLDDKARTSIKRVLSSGERMAQMIDQLLDFTRARVRGGIPLSLSAVDLRHVASQVVEELRVAHPARELCVETHGDLNGAYDAERLAQVFSNLLGNALEHGDASAPVVFTLDGTAAHELSFSVQNGGAVPPELLPILFDPFLRAEHRRSGTRGLGLGLFISRELVRAHGGDVRVSSDAGQGTRFTASLPRGQIEGTAGTVEAKEWKTTRDRLVHAERAQAHALAMEERLRLMVDSIRDYAVFMLDAQGNVQSWNRGAQLIKGYCAEEIIGRHFSAFYPPEDIAAGKCEQELKDAAALGRWEDEGWRLRKDGTRFWASVIITALRDDKGQLVGFGKVTRDLTERKRAQDALQLSEDRFRRLVDSVHDHAIFMLDPEGTVMTWNLGAERIMGYRAEEIVGHPYTLLIPEGKLTAELRIAREEGRFEEEAWRVRKDGSRFWANVVLSPIRDEHGALLGFTKITRDLTARRKAEDERRQLDEAREAIRVRDEFLSIASHELKSPMMSLKLQLELLRQPESSSKPVDRALRAGEQMAGLIETLLDVSRVVTGRRPLQHEPFDLCGLVAGVVSELQKQGVALRFEPHGPVAGAWDARRLERMLEQLVLGLSRLVDGAPLELRVRHEGASAIMELRERPTPQSAMPRVRTFSAMGMGLYVARQIAEAHGGVLAEQEVPGEGARVVLELPLTPPVAAKA
jgi:PAS domain S-box-containing protein